VNGPAGLPVIQVSNSRGTVAIDYAVRCRSNASREFGAAGLVLLDEQGPGRARLARGTHLFAIAETGERSGRDERTPLVRLSLLTD